MTDNNEINILKRFKNDLIQFMDELRATLPSEPDLVVARIFLNDQVPIKDVMEWFVEQLYKEETFKGETRTIREHIKKREEEYFISNTSIFAQLSPDKVNNFKRIWRSNKLDDDDKQIIWKWVDSFVYWGDKYAKAVTASN